MNSIINWLTAGDLRTDGAANEVAALVTANPDLLPDLIDALRSPDDPIRGRAADALEKVARTQGEAVPAYLPQVIDLARRDPVPMVRWHMAMILGHLHPPQEQDAHIRDALLHLLRDASAIVRSWAVVSVCLLARRRPDWAEESIGAVQPLQMDASKAVRTRVRKALPCLLEPDADLPASWDKRRA
jgi:HEAT repeat protein